MRFDLLVVRAVRFLWQGAPQVAGPRRWVFARKDPKPVPANIKAYPERYLNPSTDVKLKAPFGSLNIRSS